MGNQKDLNCNPLFCLMWKAVNLAHGVEDSNGKAACSVYNKVKCVLPLTLAFPPSL